MVRKTGSLGRGLLIAIALAFPAGLMLAAPALMFQRGWENYLGTAVYWAALALLAREAWRIGRADRAFAAMVVGDVTAVEDPEQPLAARRRLLAAEAKAGASRDALLELNREASALDQEQAHGRLTLTRYFLYLLPVIGFIGTVRGISEALAGIGPVLRQMKDLDGFLLNLGGVTSALQIAFDSTLLALFLSAALMLVLTVVSRGGEEHLARVDRWVAEDELPRLAGSAADPAEALDRLARALAGADLASESARLAAALDRLAPALERFERGAAELGTIDRALSALAGSVAAIGADVRAAAEATRQEGQESQRQLAAALVGQKDALELLQVSLEQGNALYRTIVKRMFADRGEADAVRVA